MPSSPKKSAPDGLSPNWMEAVLSHFFVNLALATDADETLVTMGMGRPHHRILTMASQAPGITINELLDILRVTHQNARLPIRKLEQEGLLELRPGQLDRRQRTLHVTVKGRRLLERLFARQRVRLERAYADVGPSDFETFLRVQRRLLDPRDVENLKRLVASGQGHD